MFVLKKSLKQCENVKKKKKEIVGCLSKFQTQSSVSGERKIEGRESRRMRGVDRVKVGKFQTRERKELMQFILFRAKLFPTFCLFW